MGQRKSYDSKSSAFFFASLGITTHQPLLQALQLPGGCSGPAQRFFAISWHFTCSMYNPFFFKYSVFLKQRCYSLQNITLFIQNKQGLVSHPANGNCWVLLLCCCWVALDSAELQVTTPFSTHWNRQRYAHNKPPLICWGRDFSPLVANMDYSPNLPFLYQKAFTDISTIPFLKLFCKRWAKQLNRWLNRSETALLLNRGFWLHPVTSSL